MIVLGESILSLLISADASEPEQMLVVFLVFHFTWNLKLYYFSTQPFHAESHAMRRSAAAGAIWSQMHAILTTALLMAGSAIKMIVYHMGKHLYMKQVWLLIVSLVVTLCGMSLQRMSHKGVTLKRAADIRAKNAIWMLRFVFIGLLIPIPFIMDSTHIADVWLFVLVAVIIYVLRLLDVFIKQQWPWQKHQCLATRLELGDTSDVETEVGSGTDVELGSSESIEPSSEVDVPRSSNEYDRDQQLVQQKSEQQMDHHSTINLRGLQSKSIGAMSQDAE